MWLSLPPHFPTPDPRAFTLNILVRLDAAERGDLGGHGAGSTHPAERQVAAARAVGPARPRDTGPRQGKLPETHALTRVSYSANAVLVTGDVVKIPYGSLAYWCHASKCSP